MEAQGDRGIPQARRGKDMPRKPLGPEQTICQAQDATRPEGGSQTPNHCDKEKQTGGVRLARTPCLSSGGAAFGLPGPRRRAPAIVTRMGRSQGPGRP